MWFCQTWDLSAGTSSGLQPSTAMAAEASPRPASTTCPAKVMKTHPRVFLGEGLLLIYLSCVCVQILRWISKLCHETVSSTDSHIPFVSFHQILHLSEDLWETIHSVSYRSNAISQSIKHTGYPQGHELMFTYMHSVHSHSVPEWNSWSGRESKTLFCLSQRHSTGGPRPNA